MSSTFLKIIGDVDTRDVNEFSESLRAFLDEVMPGRYRGEPPSDSSDTVWYMEVMGSLENGYTLFLQAWRDPKHILFSKLDIFFKKKHPTLKYERRNRGE